MGRWAIGFPGLLTIRDLVKTGRTQLQAIVLWMSVACVMFPVAARADGISIGFVAVAGVVILIPLTGFTVFVEGVVWARGLRIPYERTLRVMLAANLASLAAGIPVKIFNAWMYSQILPRPLAPYFRQYPYAVFLGSLIFFVVTLVAEYAVVAARSRRKKIRTSRRRLAALTIVANTVTYAVLAPLHFVATRPTHDVKVFTDDSAWAKQPVLEVFYIDGNGNLCSITTGGGHMRVRVPDVVRDYQYLPSQGIYLYRDGTNCLSLFRESDGTRIQCWSTGERFMMDQVACSPDGRIVAYLSRVGEPPSYELVLYDCRDGQTVRTGVHSQKDDYDTGIAWAEDPSRLIITGRHGFLTVSIGSDLTATLDERSANNTHLAKVYGRFGGDWGVFSVDERPDVRAYAEPGLGSHLGIRQKGSLFVVADNPGFLKLGKRIFNDICLLDNGEELLFDDRHDIYLLNLTESKVVRVVEGSKFVTLSPRDQRKIEVGADRAALFE